MRYGKKNAKAEKEAKCADEKELCFILDGEFIYLEQSLVDFNDVPIFFLCKDRNSHFYIALCTDFENFDYLGMKVSVAEVKDLLHQRITMREIITKQNSFWKIETGKEIELDKVERLPMERVDHSVLPKEGTFFKVLTDEMREFVKKFEEYQR
ncbi:MAG: hypothetical protein K2H85_00905 [Allobaculum sp.]|nr:hypothetical protein [Allobaculum sp.]